MMAPFKLGLLDFLQKETGRLNRKLLVMTAATSAANCLMLTVINGSVQKMNKQGDPFTSLAQAAAGGDWLNFALFALALVLFVYSIRFTLYESTEIAEQAVASVRLRLADKIRRTDLAALEAIGEADIHARINRETSAVVQAARPLFSAAQSAILVVFILCYVAVVSPSALVFCVAMLAVGVAIYHRDRVKIMADFHKASAKEDELFSSLAGIMKGFKELRLNRPKSDDVFADYSSTTRTVEAVRTKVMLKIADTVVFAESFIQVLLGSIVFILPMFSATFSANAVKVVAAVLFLVGPLGNVVMLFPLLRQTEVTVENLQRLEARLDEGLQGNASGEEEVIPDLDGFSEITMNGMGFTYHLPDGSATFALGPVDAVLRRGELLFLVGGNGSGKTTFMKVLTSLYLPSQGAISVDGTLVTSRNAQSYRSLFSAIFSDFHLFDRPYGLRDVDPARVTELLKVMGIAHKTTFQDGRFTNVNLSTGQRKRLALVVAFLEDKPIYVFDEVAADQDPAFRTYFYEVLLTDLKKAGKTVIAVSHDDRYFHVADRVLKMEEGRIVESAAAPPPPAGRPGSGRTRAVRKPSTPVQPTDTPRKPTKRDSHDTIG